MIPNQTRLFGVSRAGVEAVLAGRALGGQGGRQRLAAAGLDQLLRVLQGGGPRPHRAAVPWRLCGGEAHPEDWVLGPQVQIELESANKSNLGLAWVCKILGSSSIWGYLK